MTAQMLQDLRYVVLYPLIVVGGVTWAVAFVLRWRRTHCRGDLWSAVLASALALWALFGLAALWMAGPSGFNVSTSLAFTIGMVAPALVLTVGAVRLLWQAWRHA